MKNKRQFAPIIAILAAALTLCAYPVRAQRGARAFAVSSAPPARPTPTQASASHAPNLAVAVNRQTLRSSSSQTNPILTSGSKFPPVNRRRPVAPVRTSGYYWIFDGGTYWVPAGDEQAMDQPQADLSAAGQMSGGQSVDPDQNQVLGASVGIEQVSGSDAQSSTGNFSALQAEAEKESSAVPDEGEFTLVLNSGRWIEAVAFTRSNDTIVYITTAGSRYTIAANELDSESTLRVNQERGTPLQSPL